MPEQNPELQAKHIDRDLKIEMASIKAKYDTECDARFNGSMRFLMLLLCVIVVFFTYSCSLDEERNDNFRLQEIQLNSETPVEELS